VGPCPAVQARPLRADALGARLRGPAERAGLARLLPLGRHLGAAPRVRRPGIRPRHVSGRHVRCQAPDVSVLAPEPLQGRRFDLGRPCLVGPAGAWHRTCAGQRWPARPAGQGCGAQDSGSATSSRTTSGSSPDATSARVTASSTERRLARTAIHTSRSGSAAP